MAESATLSSIVTDPKPTPSPPVRTTSTQAATEPRVVDQRRPWVRPRLEHYGDVRQLTLGPTPGVGESGNPAIFKPS